MPDPSLPTEGPPLHIGIMLRTIDETGGIGVYTRNIVEELLRIDQRNRYSLFYRTPRHLGRYAQFANATESLIRAPHKVLWDQWAIPRAAARAGVEVLFHPKFTVPFLTSIPSVMVVHGADWFIPPYHKVYNRLDTAYIRTVMPWYFRKAARVISVSRYSTRGFADAMPTHRHKLETIYFAPNRAFRRVEDQAVLQKVRARYQLPDPFILTVIRYDGGRKKYRKNFGNMAQGFARCKRQHGIPHALVVAGKGCDQFGRDHDLAAMDIANDVQFPGLVAQEDLPAFYTLADAYLYPTVIEAFPIPITEALSCGCPIVTSRGTGLEELAGDAALLVDPADPVAIGDALHRILTESDLRETLRRRGLERAALFDWSDCAHRTLDLLTRVAHRQPGRSPGRAREVGSAG